MTEQKYDADKEDAARRFQIDLANGVAWAGWDLAKPGSDKTVYPSNNSVKPTLDKPDSIK